MTSNPNSANFDYKDYSLEKLQEWVHDAIDSDASPHEIYSAIREVVREDYYYHKDRLSRASGLLELLSGHRPVKDEKFDYSATGEKFPSTPVKYDEHMKSYAPYVNQFKPQNGVTHKEYTKAKIEANSAWNDGWTKQYYQKIVDKYEGKQPKKWTLPVEQSVVDGVDDYYIQFPDDLLEAANLKEGDQVEWVDQGDGSYLLKKVPMTYDETVAAGWTMTADGFWIKE